MKKLNLDETWRLCLQMWKWIARERRKNQRTDIGTLKRQWLREHGIESIRFSCFFCEYGQRFVNSSLCQKCPAKMVDKNFNCEKDGRYYHWSERPVAFYNKLVQLNKRRKKK